MTRTPGPLRLLLAAACAALALTGCSEDDPAPKIDPGDSSSAAATPTPTSTAPVEPTLPAEAEGTDAAAAEAFVEFYWEMVNYAQATGDVDGLRELALESCAACKGGADGISQIHSADGLIDGGVVTVQALNARRFESGPATGFIVIARTDVSPQVIRVPGKKAERYAGGPGEVQMIVQSTDDGWRIGRWDAQ
ncbi:DUF6318 family protein [Nocardioides pantholopis]|uniref:DUF6318 family protein n=1 Tax=Nocardioides pantholopis TaxID=2483798 RepID=UPI000FD81153|nr:DUF6318 family protein [Nocardioides pantholopis]